ncbi:hypothetical protein Sango_0945600 [Sesamum angolense]|uniref:START domain-containing protein n=1 Tax=Sesamum angolense TaxID=2727404 RepID=A0AAE2BY55_9LAMI|nr:hypothetical protein Sango_0945600 [Sesamum angolense]
MRSSPSTCGRSWSISEDSLRRYVFHASENCIQELLSASDTNRAESFTLNDGWKVVAMENGVEISKRRSGSLHTFRSRRVLKSVSPQQFMTVANAIDAAKEWDADLVEANYIKDLEENLSIIRLRFGEKSNLYSETGNSSSTNDVKQWTTELCWILQDGYPNALSIVSIQSWL